MFKPFKPLSLKQRPLSSGQDAPSSSKKRRISDNDDTATTLQVTAPSRVPLSVVPRATQPSASPQQSQTASDGRTRYYSILWRKVTNKKHKTWDGDGSLTVTGGYAILKDERGKDMGRTACKTPLLPGSTLSMSGKEVEIDSLISKDDIPGVDTVTASKRQPEVTLSRSFENKPRVQVRPSQMPAELTDTSASSTRPSQKPTTSISSAKPRIKVEDHRKPSTQPSAFKNPLLNQQQHVATDPRVPTPKHDPNAEGALVMTRPVDIPTGKAVVDVVVDPLVCKHLREHQREGVAFLYDCVMGIRSNEGLGAILADDMGLGKSLQVIALLWTLIKQNPIAGSPPVVHKAIIVCPATLCVNWRKEFRKWVGAERIGVLVADEKTRISSFTKGRSYNVLIISYEKFCSVQQDLQKADIDIVIADEGHRLKTAKNKAAAAIKSLNTERRVVLTGTLFQNEFREWYQIVDLINPGLLGNYNNFKKNFELPINKGRQQEATEEEKEIGKERDQELKGITGPFILRREHSVLAKFLPPKTEYVLFCRPNQAQINIYNAVLNSELLGTAFINSKMQFTLITALRKVCNSPSLLPKGTEEADQESQDLIVSTVAKVVSQKQITNARSSGKLRALDDLLHHIWQHTTEKVVIMSNWTTTLDLIGEFMSSQDYSFERLDGKTPSSKRQGLVDAFNQSDRHKQFAFLLSTKTGGMGINLIGASRLILFDIDWNPAFDLQAMARICRDGQKRPCHIYRLLTKGGLDEKIFQRQIFKQGLADSVVDNKASTNSFSQEELRDLFTLDQRDTCQTHDLLGCECAQDGHLVQEAHKETDTTEAEDGGDLPEAEDVLSGGFPSWLTASQVNQQKVLEADKKAAEAVLAKRNMLGLMRYAHLDSKAWRKEQASEQSDEAEPIDIEELEDDDDASSDTVDSGTIGDIGKRADALQDDVLKAVMARDDSPIDYVFLKTGHSEDVREEKSETSLEG
ncbi:hypothetical protein MBLNU457_g0139t1 [Dothideomycetes sp. NU457]